MALYSNNLILLVNFFVHVNYLLDIHTFIVGGGISRAYDLFAPIILEELQKRVFLISKNQINVIRAQLGNTAGVLGAGFLAQGLLS